MTRPLDARHPRPDVQWFALEMERALRANDHKGGWWNSANGWLLRRLGQEVRELRRAMRQRSSEVGDAALIREAADVANLAMMIADNVRAGRE